MQLLDCGETVLADSGWCRIDPKSVEVVVVVVGLVEEPCLSECS